MSYRYRLEILPLVALFAGGGLVASSTAIAQASASEDVAAAPPSLGVGVTVGAIWSDNLSLVPMDKNSGTIGQVGVNLLLNQKSRRLESDIDLNAGYEHYFDDEFDPGVIGGLDGKVTVGIAPERFEWLFQDNFGQTQLNSLAAVTPDNRENVNYFTTGPTFTFRLSQVNSLMLAGRYSTTDYETTALDGDRYSATLAFIHRLSAASLVSLNATGERLRYDDGGANSDYSRYEAYARYELNSRRTNVGLDLGYTAIESDIDSSNGPLLRLSAKRQLSPATSLSFNLGTEFSDSSNAFRSRQNLSGVSLDPESVLATSDAFERRFASLGWDFDRNRTSFGASGEYIEEIHETLGASDRSLSRAAIYFGRRLTPSMRFRLDGRYSSEEFDLSGSKIDELHGSASLILSTGRTLSWRIQYDYRDRTGTGPVAEYVENRASLFVTWMPQTAG